MSKKFAILYGLMEGDWHGRKLISELEQAGLEQTETLESADILFAHSGGWLFLPKLHSEQRVIIVNPSYISEIHYIKHLLRRISYDIRFVLFSKDWPW